MSKAKKTVELAKTALIALLTVSAFFLALRTGLFNDVFATLPIFGNVAGLVRETAGPTGQNGTTIKEAARPLTIVVTNEDGGRFGVRYDTDVRNAIYVRASSIFGEALGSASTPMEISEDEWREALSKHNVYFEYITPIRLSVLDGWLWLGARMSDKVDDFMIRRIFVAFGEERSRIYFQDQASGLFFGADTASAAGKAQELEMYGENGAQFAFELGGAGSEIAPYMLIMLGGTHPNVLSSDVGSSLEQIEITLAALGHVNETFAQYYSGDTLVGIGTQFRIRARPDGRILYRRTDRLRKDEEVLFLSEIEMIERARVIVADSIGRTSGNAEIMFELFEYGEDVYAVHFAYYIAGGRIFLQEDRTAAMVTFSSGVVSEVELDFRNFTPDGEYTRLLPERQTLAAAGGEFMLSYSDTGSDVLQPFWVLYGF